MEKKEIPVFRFLDSPSSFAGRPLLDVSCFVLPFFSGIVCRHLILGTLIGIVLYRIKRKIAREFPKHFFYGLLYWVLPPFFCKLVPSHKRFFLR
ncbi:type IV conjugative transfer system protein TraL [Simkania negevensis]|uniref:Conjugal transfer pore protein TraL n=1 Tax=Simkania negevensis (strain ATCC VR-1471 / DSM 27360 / Z) TaxID=331113 RepID=F8L2Z3_SIMNZ|nr:conjugal transfer pore protein TraL [Simkania negevensis Z]